MSSLDRDHGEPWWLTFIREMFNRRVAHMTLSVCKEEWRSSVSVWNLWNHSRVWRKLMATAECERLGVHELDSEGRSLLDYRVEWVRAMDLLWEEEESVDVIAGMLRRGVQCAPWHVNEALVDQDLGLLEVLLDGGVQPPSPLHIGLFLSFIPEIMSSSLSHDIIMEIVELLARVSPLSMMYADRGLAAAVNKRFFGRVCDSRDCRTNQRGFCEMCVYARPIWLQRRLRFLAEVQERVNTLKEERSLRWAWIGAVCLKSLGRTRRITTRRRQSILAPDIFDVLLNVSGLFLDESKDAYTTRLQLLHEVTVLESVQYVADLVSGLHDVTRWLRKVLGWVVNRNIAVDFRLTCHRHKTPADLEAFLESVSKYF